MSQIASNTIFLTDVRLSFASLVEPKEQKRDDGSVVKSYEADFIMAPNHPGFQQFMALWAQIAAAEWKEHAQTVLNMVNADRKQRCYGSGHEKINNKTMQIYDGYADNVFVKASCNADRGRPQFFDASGQLIDPNNQMAVVNEARRMYGGCRVNAAIKPWAQNNAKGGKGVRCELVGLQFLRDDAAFGGGKSDATGLFGAVPQSAPTATTAAPVMPAAPFPNAGMAAPMTIPAAPVMPGFAAPQPAGLSAPSWFTPGQ